MAKRTSPWGLTKSEERALLAIPKSGRNKLAAKELKVSPQTVAWNVVNARKKMGEKTALVACVRYQRFMLTGEMS